MEKTTQPVKATTINPIPDGHYFEPMTTNSKSELARRERLRLEIIQEARERAEALRKFAAIGNPISVAPDVAAHYAEAGATFAMMALEARGVKL